jgi:hypothetical protein
MIVGSGVGRTTLDAGFGRIEQMIDLQLLHFPLATNFGNAEQRVRFKDGTSLEACSAPLDVELAQRVPIRAEFFGHATQRFIVVRAAKATMGVDKARFGSFFWKKECGLGLFLLFWGGAGFVINVMFFLLASCLASGAGSLWEVVASFFGGGPRAWFPTGGGHLAVVVAAVGVAGRTVMKRDGFCSFCFERPQMTATSF